jgi:dihydroorotate dehydrogenase electron transfer subunit
MKHNQMRIVTVQRIKAETSKIKTLYFKDELCRSAEPGQFIMVWVPGVDEIPLSLSSISDEMSSVTVKEVGEATRTLCGLREGASLGIRGPFGNHFRIVNGEALIVAGGIGAAPLMSLTVKLISHGVRITFIEGAKRKDDLIFVEELTMLLRKAENKVIFATDDGSYGEKGLATDIAEKVLSSSRYNVIYSCGNEAMIRRIFFLAQRHKTPLQASLERIMRCAVGICGSCVIGRYRVCKDGPIFDEKMLEEVKKELGRFKRGFDGRKYFF